jgi:hypothetical protein
MLKNMEELVGLSGFEPESLAPQARRIPSYPTDPVNKGVYERGLAKRNDLFDQVRMGYYHTAAAVAL